jgi:hypothetical protein
MLQPTKAWRVTLILELDRCLSDDEFGQLTADCGTRSTVRRGSRQSQSAPEMSVTSIATTVKPEDAVGTAVLVMEQRLAALPTHRQILRVRNYLVAA